MRSCSSLCVALVLVPMWLSAEIPLPDPSHEGLNTKSLGRLGELEVGLWLQYRVMYNNSNVPGPGMTSFVDTENYDFMRQRFRIGLDVKTSDKVGAYAQLEYRGGWGGSSPGYSDPRSDSLEVANPFNRLQARGLRYGFVYASLHDAFSLGAGILPLTDRVGRTLFDADWDFNVGGVLFSGSLGGGDYRLGYVRLVEGVGGGPDQIDKDGDLLIVDYDVSMGASTKFGAHLYSLAVPEELDVMPTKSQTWYGVTVEGKISEIGVNGMVLLNQGKFSDESHTGSALKLGADFQLRNDVTVCMQGLSTSGDEQDEIDKRFTTLHGFVGTEGFWGYTHIFTANGPSDVNDLGLEIGNQGAGLTTVQGKVDFPLIVGTLSGQLFGGWFQANKERNESKNIGSEFGGTLTCNLAENLNCEFGLAFASIGEFYASDADNLHEVYSRLQLTW